MTIRRLFVIFVAVGLFSWYLTVSAFTPSGLLEIHYINVGWGTAVLVVGPTGTTMLMDGGRDNAGDDDVIPYFQSIGLTTSDGLDYILASHQHSDHLAGLTEVMNAGYDVSTEVYYNGSNYSTSYVTAFRNAATATTAGAPIALTLGTVIPLGGGATATCICANGSVWGYGAVPGAQSDENDRSIGVLIEYGDFEFFFAGDLGGGDSDNSCTGRSTGQANVETPVAQTITPGGAHPLLTALGLEVLHVNHHGSESSTNPDYMNLLTPKFACIATGNGQSDSYMFPRHDVVDNVLLDGVYCITAPAAIVLQSEEGYPAGTLTSYSGYCLGDIVFKTNGQRLYQLSGSGRLHEGPDERAALGLPKYYALDEDTSDHVAPGAIGTLTATGGPTSTQITLRWTASGDDGTTGQAALYDIRYRASSYGPIDTEGEWNAATKITVTKFPKTSSSAETLVVSGFTSGQSYYFAMKTTDDGLNLSALSNSPLGTAGSASGYITGTVTDIRGFVSGAIVTANDGAGHVYIDTTGSNGAYLFTAVVGTYTMTFTQPIHRDTTRTGITVTNGGTTTVNMVMERLKGNIAGTVAATGVGALVDVRVQIYNGTQEDTSAANGYYILTNLIDSTYSVKFSHPDYYDTIVSGVAVAPNGTSTLNMVMRKAYGWISGTVTDTSGIPLANVYVKIQAPTLRINPINSLVKHDIVKPEVSLTLAVDSVYTDSSGHYLSMVTWGEYNIDFSKQRYLDTTVINVSVTANDTTDISLEMTPFNYLPVITSQEVDTATEHVNFKYVAMATDQDDPAIDITFSQYASWMSISADTISGIPPEAASDTTFRIIASDGVGADTLIVSLHVININNPPQITSADSAVAQQHLQVTYTASAIDPEGVTPIFAFINYPAWLNPDDSTIYGIPPANAADSSFRIIASDGVMADTQLVSIRMIQINDPPYITSADSAVATEHIEFIYTAAASDSDGTTPTLTFANYASWLTANRATLSGFPPENPADTSFEVIASDGYLTDTQFVFIHVIAINDPPVITSTNITYASSDSFYEYTAIAYDPEGLLPTIAFENYPGWLGVNGTVISGTPPITASDTTFRVIASDGVFSDTLIVAIIMSSGCQYLLGDINSDDIVLGGDVTYGVRYFKGLGPVPPDSCLLDSTGAYIYVAGDVNGNCEFRGSDISRLVSYFQGEATITNCHFFPTLPLKTKRISPPVQH